MIGGQEVKWSISENMAEGWISELESSTAQAGGKEVGQELGRRGGAGQGGGAGRLGRLSHLFTLMTLQTTNSIHTLELEGRQRQIRDGGWSGRIEFLRPQLAPLTTVLYLPPWLSITLTPRGPGYPRGP